MYFWNYKNWCLNKMMQNVITGRRCLNISNTSDQLMIACRSVSKYLAADNKYSINTNIIYLKFH